MNEPTITVIGNCVSDPDLRYLPSGVAVAKLTIASTPRIKDGDNYKDGETMWVRATVWRQLAESVAESITKGTRVIAQGRLGTNTWETKEGEKRTDIVLQVDAIGPELRYATATVNKVQRGSEARVSGGRPADDPWGSSEPAPF